MADEPKKLIAAHSSVSAPVARAMTKGVLALTNANTSSQCPAEFLFGWRMLVVASATSRFFEERDDDCGGWN